MLKKVRPWRVRNGEEHKQREGAFWSQDLSKNPKIVIFGIPVGGGGAGAVSGTLKIRGPEVKMCLKCQIFISGGGGGGWRGDKSGTCTCLGKVLLFGTHFWYMAITGCFTVVSLSETNNFDIYFRHDRGMS